MSRPMRPDQRPVEDVLRGSVADMETGRVQDFDLFLAEMAKKARQRIAEIEMDAAPQPVLRTD